MAGASLSRRIVVMSDSCVDERAHGRESAVKAFLPEEHEPKVLSFCSIRFAPPRRRVGR